jgi:hypothetical protein
MDPDIDKTRCTTCYGTCEIVSEHGAGVCPE